MRWVAAVGEIYRGLFCFVRHLRALSRCLSLSLSFFFSLALSMFRLKSFFPTMSFFLCCFSLSLSFCFSLTLSMFHLKSLLFFLPSHSSFAVSFFLFLLLPVPICVSCLVSLFYIPVAFSSYFDVLSALFFLYYLFLAFFVGTSLSLFLLFLSLSRRVSIPVFLSFSV